MEKYSITIYNPTNLLLSIHPTSTILSYSTTTSRNDTNQQSIANSSQQSIVNSNRHSIVDSRQIVKSSIRHR